MFRQRKTTYILVLYLVAEVVSDGLAVIDRGAKKFDGTDAEDRHDLEDNVADSSVTSYSSVVIHHTPGSSKRQTNGVGGGPSEQESSRSESYFKVYNTHGKRQREPQHQSRQQENRPLRQEIKIKHIEGNFKPIENIPQESKLPTRTNLKQEQSATENYRQEVKYTRLRGDRQQGFRNDGDYQESKQKYENDYKEEKYRKEPKYESGNNLDESRRQVQSLFRHDGTEQRGTYEFRHETPLKYKPKTHPPPGMSDELMETLLQQEPQTFGDNDKVKRYELKKKFKGTRGESGNSFNVGYSIGFGQQASDEVVFGKPKDVKLHVNGQKSVWKQLNEGVEMSQDLEKKKPLLYRVPDSAPRSATPHINVLKNGGSSVFYMNNASPDINNIPTEGKGSFDHNHALTQSNVFDFSNAMMNPPLALPLHSSLVPEVQPYSLKPKGRGYDLMSLYQSMGYSPPIPVFIPDAKGEGQMIQAIVIPLQSLTNIDFNWGHFANMYNDHNTITPQHAFNTFITPNINVPVINKHQTINTHTFHGKPGHFSHQDSSNKQQRSPKSQRKPKDSVKSSSTFTSSPIIVPSSIQSHRNHQDLQREQATLNAILAKEMSRKNQRHSPMGLKPPPAPHS